jgi:hypothetical protein
MVNVTIQGVTDPDGDPVTINIDQIKPGEPTEDSLGGAKPLIQIEAIIAQG